MVDDLVKHDLTVRDDAPAGARKAVRLTSEGGAVLERGLTVAERLRAEDEAGLAPADPATINFALSTLLSRLSEE